MLARFKITSYETMMTINEYIVSAFFTLEDLILGKTREALTDRDNLVKNHLTSQALKNESGVAVARLGPNIPGCHSNLVVIVPKSTQDIKNVLFAIEQENGGRSTMNPLADMMGHASMANQTTAEGAMFQRRMLLPFVKDVNGFLNIGREVFALGMQEWVSKNEAIVLLDEVKFLSRRVSAKRLFGGEYLSKEDNEEINLSLRSVKQKILNPLSPMVNWEFYERKYNNQCFAKKFIEERRQDIVGGFDQKNSNILSEIIKQDIIPNEIEKKDCESYIEDVRIASSVLVISALDGVYSNLMAILIQLLDKPDIIKKLYDEFKLASEDGSSISNENLKDKNTLPYLDRVFREGLRYNSSVPMLARYTTQGVEAEQISIPPHSTVLINLGAMHHHPDLFESDAKNFNPDRFFTKDIKIGDFPFTPFSVGSRPCPGAKVGEMLIKLFISELILNYEMVPLSNQPKPIVDDTISLAPEPGIGYRVFIRPRETTRLEKEVVNNQTQLNRRIS